MTDYKVSGHAAADIATLKRRNVFGSLTMIASNTIIISIAGQILTFFLKVILYLKCKWGMRVDFW